MEMRIQKIDLGRARIGHCPNQRHMRFLEMARQCKIRVPGRTMRVQHVRPELAEDAAYLAECAQAAVGTNLMKIEIAVHRKWGVPQTLRQRRALLAEESHFVAAAMQPVLHLRGVPRQRNGEAYVGCQQDAQGETSGV